MGEASAAPHNSNAAELLEEYRTLLQSNDILIASLDALQQLPDPSHSQVIRMKEIEEIQIPQGIKAEQELGAFIRELIAEVFKGDTGGTWGNAKQRAIIELRYLSLLKWETVNEVLNGEAPDFILKKPYYLRQTYKAHRAAIDNMDAALQRRSSEGGPRS